MKRLILALVLLTLPGCYQMADKTDFIKSEHFCKDKMGVKHIQVWASGSEYVQCFDGTEIHLGGVDLHESQN